MLPFTKSTALPIASRLVPFFTKHLSYIIRKSQRDPPSAFDEHRFKEKESRRVVVCAQGTTISLQSREGHESEVKVVACWRSAQELARLPARGTA